MPTERQKDRIRYIKGFSEVLAIAVLRGMIMALNLGFARKKVVQDVFLVIGIILQLCVSFSILYANYWRSNIHDAMELAYEKTRKIAALAREEVHVVKGKSTWTQSLFIAEIFAQVGSGVGVVVLAFFYKSGKVEGWVYAVLMVFFFILTSFSYVPSVINRRVSLEYITEINQVLDDILRSRGAAPQAEEPSSEVTKVCERSNGEIMFTPPLQCLSDMDGFEKCS